MSQHVVLVGPFGLRPRGTMSVRALPLARALVRRGYRVTLLLPPWQNPEDAGRCWEEDGVRLENVTLPRSVPGWFHARLTAELVQRLHALQPDVVHVFKPKAYAGLVHWLTQRRYPIVVDTDDWEGPGGWNALAPYPPPLKAFFAWQERWGLTHARAVTVASRALETLTWALGVPPARVHYLPNGVAWPFPPVTPLPAPPTLLLYTRFFEFDLQRLWRIVQRVRAALPEVRLLVIGQGLFGEEQRLLELAQKEGWTGLEYAGWGELTALPGYFARAQVALYPFDDTLINRTKCPVKLLDLLAAGVPVVGDAVGQLTEMIRHGVSGLLVPAGDEAAFAEALLSLLQAPQQARAMGEQAAADVRLRFNWDRLAEKAAQVYAGVKTA